jgi:predicted transglutaminase-like cysteine proteinase
MTIKKIKSEQEDAIAAPELTHNFLRAVGNGLRCTRLGTLLKSSGLVTESELDVALRIHKETGEQLGKILVRQGIVSAAQVYRKLAEQWCLKASTAGLAVMIQAAMPSAAHAEQGISPQFQMAAATIAPSVLKPALTTPASAQRAYPDLFGSQEVRSDDISAFRKWTTVMARFEDQMQTSATSPRVMKWTAAIRNLQDVSTEEKIRGVNDYVNQTRYIEDNQNWGKSDYWATPIEFFSKGGDCEDFAIAKYASLRALGFSTEQLRIAIVQDTRRNMPHALLIVYTDEGAFVLDNQDKRVENIGDVARYQPIFSINASSWWLHKTANT